MNNKMIAQNDRDFEKLIEPYTRELFAFCYKMLGSIHEAEDVQQELFLNAWKNMNTLNNPDALRSWLYRIASNSCLNHCRKRDRNRVLPFQVFEKTENPSSLTPPVQDPIWIEPCPGSMDDPSVAFESREKIKIAFIIAYQILNPQQRSILILRDVLDFSSKETAEILDLTTASVNSSLLRARSKLERNIADYPTDEVDVINLEQSIQQLADNFLHYWENSDVNGLVSLMQEDVILSMPPLSLWVQGRDDTAAFFSRFVFSKDTILKPIVVNEQMGFAGYRRDGDFYVPHTILILSIQKEEPAVTNIISFLNPALFRQFDLPLKIPVKN